MYYISKGAVCAGSTEDRLTIAHGEHEFVLIGVEAAIWLNGRTKVSSTEELWAIRHLYRMGLLEYDASNTPEAVYEMLTRCTLCRSVKSQKNLLLSKDESFILNWLKQAGIRLTLAELVCLAEQDLAPTPELTGSENRKALIYRLYLNTPIQDNTLEQKMMASTARDRVVNSVLKLLKRGKLILL